MSEAMNTADRIKALEDFKDVSDLEIDGAIKTAGSVAKSYGIDPEVCDYATFLYACHLLMIIQNGGAMGTTVNAGAYSVNRDTSPNDGWLKAFNELVSSQGHSMFGRAKSLY